MTEHASSIPERAGVTPELFQQEVLPAARPVVFRGLVADWPAVQAGRRSPEAICDYLKRFDRGYAVTTVFGPPGIKGRFFYNDDFSGFNFQAGTSKLSAALDFLLAHANHPEPSSLAIQSAPVRQNLPGFESENRMLLAADVEPRVWIGNRVVVAAHHDPSENIACVVAGRRRFTLFPPEQVANLYVGPYELTPAGTTISMVSFDEPDFERYPRFADALKASMVADLGPGDAIYIPYHWWHHVRSTEPFNMLVNYWWAPPANGRGAPRDAFLHAMLSIKELPESHRNAWRALFEHYVFEVHGPTADHLPPERRGILGPMDAQSIRGVRAALARVLGRG